MQTTEIEDRRRQELLALINMMGFALNSAKDVGADAAATHMEVALWELANELQAVLPEAITKDDITQLAAAQSGHC